MAFRAFRRTVSLDVSQLAATNDRKKVCELIVNHFANHTIHAVQFVGTVAKVTFAVEASKQEVINHQAVSISGVQCAVRGGGPRAQNVLIYNYPVEGSEDSIRRVLGVYGVIERITFRHWPHLTDVSDGVRVVRMIRRQAIPRILSIAEVNVKVAYAGQQQVCDLCQAPGHIARACPLRDKCFQCGLEGHFSRDCPQRRGYRDRDAVFDASDPTPAEAAGRSAAVNDSPVIDAVPHADTDSLDGASLSSVAGRDMDSQLDADAVSSDSDCTPSVGPTPDNRDNQLDELASQSLFSSPAPSGADVDSLQGATVESVCFDSPASPSPPGQGPPSGASNVGLLGKIKQKVGLNKKKDSKVVDNVNVSDTGNGKVHSHANTSISNEMSNSSGNNNVSDISCNVKTPISNGNNNVSEISNNAKSSISNGKCNSEIVSSQNLSESGYIGQGVLAGRENNSDMELEVESQKRSHPDSDSVDSVDDNSFVMPVPPPSFLQKEASCCCLSRHCQARCC